MIIKESGRDIIRYIYSGEEKGKAVTLSLGKNITKGCYLKKIDTLVGYDENFNIFLYELGTQKGIANIDMVEDPYIYRSMKTFGETLVYLTAKNIVKIIPGLLFLNLQLQKVIRTVAIPTDQIIIDYAYDETNSQLFLLTKCGKVYLFYGQYKLTLDLQDYLMGYKFEAWTIVCFTPDDPKINFLAQKNGSKNAYCAASVKIENSDSVMFLISSDPDSTYSGGSEKVALTVLSSFRIEGNFSFYEVLFDYLEIGQHLIPVVICFSEKKPVKILILTIENGRVLRSLGSIFKLKYGDKQSALVETDIRLRKTKFEITS